MMKITHLTNEQLQRLTEEISDAYLGVPYYGKISFNKKRRTPTEPFYHDGRNIRINPETKDYNYLALIGVIRHELCHYYLSVMVPKAEVHGNKFQALSQKIGGIHYLSKPPQDYYNYTYQCTKCGFIYFKKKRMDYHKRTYYCKWCNGKIKPIPDPLSSSESE